jgi:hypothetical protein
MKQFLAVLAAALLVTGIYALTAGAGGHGVSPAKVAKLAKQVKKLQKEVNLINSQLACFNQAAPITQYQGYVYGDVANPSAFQNTTGLDVTATGDTVGAWFLVVDSRCVQGGKAPPLFKHFRGLHAHR